LLRYVDGVSAHYERRDITLRHITLTLLPLMAYGAIDYYFAVIELPP